MTVPNRSLVLMTLVASTLVACPKDTPLDYRHSSDAGGSEAGGPAARGPDGGGAEAAGSDTAVQGVSGFDLSGRPFIEGGAPADAGGVADGQDAPAVRADLPRPDSGPILSTDGGSSSSTDSGSSLPAGAVIRNDTCYVDRPEFGIACPATFSEASAQLECGRLPPLAYFVAATCGPVRIAEFSSESRSEACFYHPTTGALVGSRGWSRDKFCGGLASFLVWGVEPGACGFIDEVKKGRCPIDGKKPDGGAPPAVDMAEPADSGVMPDAGSTGDDPNRSCMAGVAGGAVARLFQLPGAERPAEQEGDLNYYRTRMSELAAIAQDDANLYLCHGAVVKVPKDGTPATILARSGCAWGITVGERRLFWIGDGTPTGGVKIQSVSTSGGAVATLASATAATAITAHGDRLFWADNVVSDPTGGTGQATIASMPLAGGAKQALYTGLWDITRVHGDDTAVYWVAWASAMPRPLVHRLTLGDGATKIIFDKWGGTQAGLAMNADKVFVAAESRLWAITKAAPDPARELGGLAIGDGSWSRYNKPHLTRALVADESSVFVGLNPGGTFDAQVQVMPVGGGAPRLLATCQAPVIDLAIDASTVYVVIARPTTVWSIKR